MSNRDEPPRDDASEAAGAFAEGFYEQAEASGLLVKRLTRAKVEEMIDDLCTWAWKQMGEAYQRGYYDGSSDEGMARECQLQKEESHGH